MEPSNAKSSSSLVRDDRFILHFDYDCFYAQVAEHQQPALKALPLGIKQKSILATCNYVARRRGVKKLMRISDAKKLCPDLVLVNGEDLSAFRDVSKRLYGLLRAASWNGKLERLGLDEVFMDVTDIVAYNVTLLNRHALHESFFYLSREDPELGFAFDATTVAGCTVGGSSVPDDDGSESGGSASSAAYLGTVVASHLAWHLRLRIEDEENYTCAVGIARNKVLAKLAGNCNKPRNQTTLLALRPCDVLAFVDPHLLRAVSGIGAKTTRLLEEHVLGTKLDPDVYTMDCTVTVGQVRSQPGMSAALLERILGGPGAERGIGEKVWGLLRGVDLSEVKPATGIPTQIGIEDTYQGLTTLEEINRELRQLGASLLRRMHVDLVVEDEEEGRRKWVAHPRTIRLSTRPKTSLADAKPYDWARASRSMALPGYVFALKTAGADPAIVERLAAEVLLPMFHKLNPDRSALRIGMINISVANMAVTGNDEGRGSGRDIGVMFRRQEDVLREWTAYDEVQEDDEKDGEKDLEMKMISGPTDDLESEIAANHSMMVDYDGEDDGSVAEPWQEDDRGGMECCSRCGRLIPMFAMLAHERYHDLEDT